MASLITHRWVGETAYPFFNNLNPIDRGSFLLGCILVDLHSGFAIDRDATHFADRIAPDGPKAYHKSCDNFLNQLDRLLVRPWAVLTNAEKSFVAGYLAHLAADEAWKKVDLEFEEEHGISWCGAFSPDVILTIFDELVIRAYPQIRLSSGAPSTLVVPHVFTHLSYPDLRAFWTVARSHVLGGMNMDSYLEMLKRVGKSSKKIHETRIAYDREYVQAVEFISVTFGGIQPRLDAMLARTLEQVPRLWRR